MRKLPAMILATFALITGCTTNDGLAPEPKGGSGAAGVLAPLERLKPDTSEAALFDWKAAATPHVGAWATDAVGCGQIDIAPDYAGFAIITVKTLRQGPMNCAISVKSAGEPVAALCNAGGATAPREFTFSAQGDDRLTIADAAGKTGYIRCRLP
ncbi:MAG: hypothetical protein IPL47_06940 [Phyllobacteriaceae bacterium]|nr:hypothetical protein [Phyllobacteriaceae bacterium]